MLWVQALHVIFMVCWFAGLFYLPRIFVYYAQADDVNTQRTLATMARKLFKFVTPFMVLTVIFGLWRLSYQMDYYLASTWMQLKLGGAALLIAIISNAESIWAASIAAKMINPMFFIVFLTRPRYWCCSPLWAWFICDRSNSGLSARVQPCDNERVLL